VSKEFEFNAVLLMVCSISLRVFTIIGLTRYLASNST
jgi:hypothetical protein